MIAPKKKPVRMCMLTDTLYNDYGNYAFSPDAPPFPALAPVKGRATPDTAPPRLCTVNYRTGTVQCIDDQSHGELHPYAVPGFGPLRMPVPSNMNYVMGGSVVAEPPDSPLNRILQRPPTGPWQLVGAAVAHHEHTPPKARTMLVYAQTVDASRDRYNYRVVDGNSVPLDIGHKVHWKQDGDQLHIPAYGGNYHLMLYQTYR
jgi:hypothetical protein